MSLINVGELEKYGYTIQWYLTDVAKYIALWSISQASKEYGFNYVLGGGTAINDVYFPSRRRRFSRDIDLYLVDVESTRFLEYVNKVLESEHYYKVIDVIGYNATVQGFTYDGVRRNSVAYKFRLELPPSIHSGLKLTDILPYEVKRRDEFNKWVMENKHRLPRIYEIEVSVFRGEKRYANPVLQHPYELPIRSITEWIRVPDVFTVNVFSLEDLVASKIEGIVSGLVARGVFPGKVTGRRTIKSRDIYDVTIVFLDNLCDKRKLVKSLTTLNLDIKYALKAVRLAMLYALININIYRELTEIVPTLRKNLQKWVTMVLEAYEKTLEFTEQTPEDYIAYKLALGEEVDTKEVKRKFNISSPQVTHILSKLEKLGFPINTYSASTKSRIKR